jgi:hypothetical protein
LHTLQEISMARSTTSTTSTTSTASTVSPGARLRTARVIRNGSIAVFAATAANTIVAGVLHAVDVTLEMTEPDGASARQIPVLAFAAATWIAGGLGLVLAAFLAKRGRPGRRFAIATGVLTLLSLVSPLAADAPTGTKLVLIAAHLLAGAIVIPVISRELDAEPSSADDGRGPLR